MHHHHHPRGRFGTGPRAAWGAFALVAAVWGTTAAQAHPAAPTARERATAQHVAQQGVALSELAPHAPERYTVQRGDTLWGIAGLYLARPWRWPELWGMNLPDIANPHLIYPGQTLYLDRHNGFARLRTGVAGELETVRIAPRARSTRLSDSALPTLKPHLIEPFLVEPLVVDAQTLQQAPRIVASVDERVLMTTGDRAYARGDAADPLRAEPGQPRMYRIVRQAVPLKDPLTQEVLGYEAVYVGQAELVRGEAVEETANGKGGIQSDYVPATLDITSTKEEVRAGDRLLPAPVHAFLNYTPHAPQGHVDARVVSLYGGSAVANAAQNQVIAINRGEQDGIQVGHVLNLLTRGTRLKDSTDPTRAVIKLPSESNGMAMVFRTFERVSYALILDVRTPVGVGDRLVNPD